MDLRTAIDHKHDVHAGKVVVVASQWTRQREANIYTFDTGYRSQDRKRHWPRSRHVIATTSHFRLNFFGPCMANTTTNFMLTRRIFQQLTDSILLGRSVNSQCFRSRSIHKATFLAFRNARCSSSSTRWKSRQSSDKYTKEAKVQGLKSRAAFKLLEVCGLEHRREGDNMLN
jgi:hypothetical protein